MCMCTCGVFSPPSWGQSRYSWVPLRNPRIAEPLSQTRTHTQPRIYTCLEIVYASRRVSSLRRGHANLPYRSNLNGWSPKGIPRICTFLCTCCCCRCPCCCHADLLRRRGNGFSDSTSKLSSTQERSVQALEMRSLSQKDCPSLLSLRAELRLSQKGTARASRRVAQVADRP